MYVSFDNMLDHPVLKQLLDIIPDGIFALDNKGKIIFWSNSMEQITGISAREAMRQTCRFLGFSTCLGIRGPGDIKRCEAFRGNSLGAIECFVRHKTGRDVPVIKNAIPVKDNNNRVIGVIEAITDLSELEKEKTRAEEAARRLGERHQLDKIIGKSAEIQSVFTAILAAASSSSTVMIQGESGTGKELVAGAIHYKSRAAHGPFVIVNCSALPENLLESELFGHVKGAFTGAASDRVGRMEEADGGTLFLDEIGELSPLVQVKLLRVLQERTIERIGESKKRQLDIRIIAATHRDLYALVRQGEFREDLYYRLKVFPIQLPPLRARKTDIPLLVKHFIDKQNLVTGKQIGRVAPGAMQSLMDYDWPGNVRELENAVEHAFVLCQSRTITINHLPLEIREPSYRPRLLTSASGNGNRNGTILEKTVRPRLNKKELTKTLHACNWNKAEAARRLGVSRTAVWKRMKQWQIPLERA